MNKTGAPIRRSVLNRAPTPVALDSNIYDLLADDAAIVELILRKISEGHLEVIVPRTVAEELRRSPFKGIPTFFPTVFKGNTVGRAGLMTCGDSIGPGETFDAHKGSSHKINDALIADAAESMAQWLVTNDARFLSRMAKLAMKCEALSYDAFKGRLGTLS